MAGRTLDQIVIGGFSNLPSQTAHLLGIAAITAVTFFIDLTSPHHFTAGLLLYYFAIFLSSKLRTPRAAYGIMAIVSVLSAAAYYVKSDVHLDIDLANRLVIVAVLWVMALFANRRAVKEQDLIKRWAGVEGSLWRRETIESSKFSVQIIDRAGNKLLVNQALADMMGYETAEELLSAPRMTLVAPHDREYVRERRVFYQSLENTELPIYDFDGLRKDGSIIRLQAVTQQIDWEGATAFRRTLIDISDRHRAEISLADSERRYRDLIEENPLGMQIVDGHGNRLLVNRALVNMLGYESAEEVRAIPWRGFLAAYDPAETLSLEELENLGKAGSSIVEVDMVRKDGSVLPVQIFRRLLIWEGEKAIQRTYIDISERKRAQQALVDSERQYRDLIENSTLGIRLLSRDGTRLFVNRALATLLGYETTEEYMKAPRLEHVAPQYRTWAKQNLAYNIDNLQFASGQPSSYEIDMLRRDGSQISVQVFWRIAKWNGEEVIQRTYIDITERKRAEAALLDSERRYRGLFEGSRLGIRITDELGNRLTNQAMAELLGYETVDELQNLPRRHVIAPYDLHRAITFEKIEAANGNLPTPIELDLLRKDGSILSVQVFWRTLEWEGAKAVERTYIDISEHKRTEAALIEGERQYRDLIEQAPLGIQIADANGDRLLVNKALSDLLGYDDANEISAMPSGAIVAPRDQDKVISFEQLAAPDGSIDEVRELDLVRKDGAIVNTQVFRRKLVWEGHNAVQLTYVDLTERKRAESALADSESRYRDLIEGSTLGILISDRNEKRLFVNVALAKMLGYGSVAEIMCVGKFGLTAPHSRGRGYGLTGLDTTKEPHTKSHEIELLHKDGSRIPAEVYRREIEWNGEKAIQRFIVDISERKRQERALRERDRTVQELRQALSRASQISAMGEISSVIAHELHQPLAAIANTASAAQRRLADETVEKSTVLDDMLPLIAQQAERAGRVIGGIRKLFEGGRTERSVEDLDLIVDEACDLASNETLAGNIDITRHVEDPALMALVDKVQIQQVIYNLLRNAIDALEDVPNKNVTVSIRTADNQMAQICVQDNGAGLSPEATDTLFDPFVTTKKTGMGMGLYTCQRIVESHGGRIWVESYDNSGTAIQFTLPLASLPENHTEALH